MRVSDFHFDLPEELIAQHPPKERGASRMLVFDRTQLPSASTQERPDAEREWLRDAMFRDLPGFLRPGDLLVLNDSRVLPARLFGVRAGLGTQAGSPRPSGVVEVLLTEEVGQEDREQGAGLVWRALVKPAKKVRVGERLEFGEGAQVRAEGLGKTTMEILSCAQNEELGKRDRSEVVLSAEVVGAGEFGERTLRFAPVEDFYGTLERIGHMPLPPYIRRPGVRGGIGERHVAGAKAPVALGTGNAGTEVPAQLEREQEGVGLEARLHSRDSPAGLKPHAASVSEQLVENEDRERYQTVYAREAGSAAAPTAGLHFTPEVLAALEARGVEIAYVTLHVGLGTFQPVRVEELKDIRLHSERYTLPPATAEALNRALAEGRRVVAVGTTTTRVLEHIAAESEAGEKGGPGLKPDCSEVLIRGAKAPRSLRFEGHSGETSIFIGPGHRFRVVQGLLTNFHLPESTLLMLVAAFAGRERVLEAYAHAVRAGYRFYSYGDCMLVG